MGRGSADHTQVFKFQPILGLNRWDFIRVPINPWQGIFETFTSDPDLSVWQHFDNITLDKSAGSAALANNGYLATLETFLYGCIDVYVQWGLSPGETGTTYFQFVGFGEHGVRQGTVWFGLEDNKFLLVSYNKFGRSEVELIWDEAYKAKLYHYTLMWTPERVDLYINEVLAGSITTNISLLSQRVVSRNVSPGALTLNTLAYYPLFSPMDVSDRAARLLGVVYGSQGRQILQRAVSYDLMVQLRAAGVEVDPRDRSWVLGATDIPDLSDRAARLLGVVYGSQGQKLQQKASTYELLTDPVDRAARVLGLIYGSQNQPLQQKASTYELLTDPVDRAARDMGKIDIAGIDVSLPAGSAIIGKVGVDQTTDETTNKVRIFQPATKETFKVVGSGAGPVFNVEASLSGVASSTNASAGANDLTGGAVDTGKLWIITQAAAYNVNTAITRITIWCDITSNPTLKSKLSPAAFDIVDWEGLIVMPVGKHMKASFMGCNAGDDIYLEYAGYVMSAS